MTMKVREGRGAVGAERSDNVAPVRRNTDLGAGGVQ